MALTKAKLVEIIAERNGFTKNKGVEVVENLLLDLQVFSQSPSVYLSDLFIF